MLLEKMLPRAQSGLIPPTDIQPVIPQGCFLRAKTAQPKAAPFCFDRAYLNILSMDSRGCTPTLRATGSPP